MDSDESFILMSKVDRQKLTASGLFLMCWATKSEEVLQEMSNCLSLVKEMLRITTLTWIILLILTSGIDEHFLT